MSPPTKPTASIDDLPPEMICELFKHLGPEDLIACSMVNRRWHSIYAGFKVRRLVAIEPHRYDLCEWFNSNRTIRQEERCCLSMYHRLAKKPLLSNLKYLVLWDFPFKFDLSQLNQFRQLVHLEIQTYLYLDKLDLKLPKLKVLAFHLFNSRCVLSVDCPELSTLLYDADNEEPNLLDLKHPETIKKLHTCLFSPHLAQFKNVESLVTDQLEAISKATFQSLPALKELLYDWDILGAIISEKFDSEWATTDRMKRALNEFVNEAKKLRGNDFRFTFSGFLLTNVNVDQIDFGVQVDKYGNESVCNEYVYMKNYHLIEDVLPFINCVDYTLLLSHVTGEFPRCFSQKFTGINEIQATAAVPDADHFLWFLKSLRSLGRLCLSSTELDQEFYDHLPTSAPSLKNLRLEKGFCKSELQVNFDFMAQFSELSSLTIVQPLSFESAISLVRSLGNSVNEGSFIAESKGERIEKNRREWRVYQKPFKLLITTENSDEIVNFLEGLKSNTPERSPASD